MKMHAMRGVRTAWTLLVLFALIFVSAPSFAQDDLSDTELAEKHFQAGAEAFYEKDYSKAVVEFMKAYRYEPDPMILYNVSAAHLKLENYENARKFARRAASDGGLPDKIKPRNNAKIAATTVRIDAARVAESVAREQDAVAQSGTPTADPSTPTATAKRDDSRLGGLGWTGISMVVVGGTLAGYATYQEVTLADDIETFEQTNDAAEYRRLESDIEERQMRGRIALYAGSGLAAVGLTLWMVDLLGDDTENNAALSVTPGRDSAHINLLFRLR